MPDTSSPLVPRLRIAGVALPIDTSHLGCAVQVSRDARGRRRIAISASGIQPPDVSAVAWSAPVLVEWRDLTSDTAAWSGLSVLSAGVQRTDDMMGVAVSWALSGVEADESASPVSIASAPYWGQVSADPIGGAIQRKTDGSGTLLRAWGKRRVSIRGESVTPPAVSPGSVSVVSARYSGSLLVTGISVADDPGTGLVQWTLVGEEP